MTYYFYLLWIGIRYAYYASFISGVAEKLRQTLLRSLIKLSSFTWYFIVKKEKQETLGCLLLPHVYTNWTAESNQISNKQKNDAEGYNKRKAIFSFVKRPNRVNRRIVFHIFSNKCGVKLHSRYISVVSPWSWYFGGVGWRSKTNDKRGSMYYGLRIFALPILTSKFRIRMLEVYVCLLHYEKAVDLSRQTTSFEVFSTVFMDMSVFGDLTLFVIFIQEQTFRRSWLSSSSRCPRTGTYCVISYKK